MKNPSNNNYYKCIHCSKPIANKLEQIQPQFKDSVKTIYKNICPGMVCDDKESLKPYLENLPQDLTVKKLTTDAEFEALSNGWKYKGDGNDFIKQLSETGHTFGLYYKEELVSWAVVYRCKMK